MLVLCIISCLFIAKCDAKVCIFSKQMKKK